MDELAPVLIFLSALLQLANTILKHPIRIEWGDFKQPERHASADDQRHKRQAVTDGDVIERSIAWHHHDYRGSALLRDVCFGRHGLTAID